jgi:tetratricopeptide (TPR) repeat protein
VVTAKDIFLDALELDAGERAAFVERECAGDETLAQRVAELLAAHTRATDVLPDEIVGQSKILAKTSTGSFQAGTSVGSYRLIRPIGEGGFGTVWIAEQEGALRRRVAIKIIKAGLDTAEVVARFEAERQALALMEHPSIASVYEGGTTETGRPWFAMEFVDGSPITEYCASRNLDTPARVELFTKVCRAVQHAHQKGIIHRDLKPRNVLVADIDGVATPKVIDFGIAKALDNPLTDRTLQTRAGSFLGTPSYMSPEQVSGSADIDTRCDVYSLGVLLYELLCGTLPFDEETMREVNFFELQRLIREVDPPRPSTRLSQENATDSTRLRHVRGELDWIVMRCLEKDRERRYDSVAILANELERHLRGEPVLAGPPDVGYRLRKFAHRNRTALATAAAVLILIVTGAVIATAQAVRATRAERSARTEAENAAEAERHATLEADRATQAEHVAREEAARATEAEKLARGEALRATEAEQLAKNEADRARTELAKFERIALFLQDMLHSVDPNVAQGRDASLLLGVLARAEERVDDEDDQPEVEAELRYTIGLALFSLSDFKRALPHLERCASLREEVFGPDAATTLDALNDLAALYLRLDRDDDALPLILRVIEGRRALFGEVDQASLTTLESLAVLRHKENKLEEAEALFRTAEEGFTGLFGPDDLNTVRASNNLASVLDDLGQYDEAESRLRHALDIQAKELGARDPHTLKAMNNLAHLLLGKGEFEEAVELLEGAIELKRVIFEPGHPSLIISLNNLGSAYKDVGRDEEAEEVYRDALAMGRETFGDEHSMTVGLMNNLGAFLSQHGDHAEAEEFLRLAWEGGRVLFGDTHPRTLTSKNSFAMTLYEQGRADEAAAIVAEVVEAAPAAYPPGSSTPGTYWINLGKCLARTEHIADALDAYAKGYELVHAVGDEAQSARAVEGLAELLEREGRDDEAALWRERLSETE